MYSNPNYGGSSSSSLFGGNSSSSLFGGSSSSSLFGSSSDPFSRLLSQIAVYSVAIIIIAIVIAIFYFICKCILFNKCGIIGGKGIVPFYSEYCFSKIAFGNNNGKYSVIIYLAYLSVIIQFFIVKNSLSLNSLLSNESHFGRNILSFITNILIIGGFFYRRIRFYEVSKTFHENLNPITGLLTLMFPVVMIPYYALSSKQYLKEPFNEVLPKYNTMQAMNNLNMTNPLNSNTLIPNKDVIALNNSINNSENALQQSMANPVINTNETINTNPNFNTMIIPDLNAQMVGSTTNMDGFNNGSKNYAQPNFNINTQTNNQPNNSNQNMNGLNLNIPNSNNNMMNSNMSNTNNIINSNIQGNNTMDTNNIHQNMVNQSLFNQNMVNQNVKDNVDNTIYEKNSNEEIISSDNVTE